jgi:hypothetical protein
MDADFFNSHDLDRIARIAAALRELDADLPMAAALDEQVTVLDRAKERSRADTAASSNRRTDGG